MGTFEKTIKALMRNFSVVFFLLVSLGAVFYTSSRGMSNLVVAIVAGTGTLVASLYYDRIKYDWVDN